MTKFLIKKEFILTAHPMTYIMMFFGAMVLIPNYPYTIALFYVCLGIFFDFINARENKDFYYMSQLPVSKKDIVKAKCVFVMIIELASVLFSVPFAFISVNINPNGSNLAGIDANVAFFGFAFMVYAIFNYVFLTQFFKTAYKAGVSFLLAVIPTAIFMIAVEVSSHIPGISDFIDSTLLSVQLKQLPILAVGIIFYFLSLALTFSRSASNFEKVDL